MKFSLVIPCYNESANIPLLLERCKTLGAQPTIEVILVDNGSTDRTPEVLQELLPQYPGCRSVRVEKIKDTVLVSYLVCKLPKEKFLAGRMLTCKPIRTMRYGVWNYLLNMVTIALSKGDVTDVL